MIHALEHLGYEISRKRITDQKGLWINTFLRQTAFALIGIFSIIFVFEFGRERFLETGVNGGLKLVLAYVLIIRLVILLLVIWVGNELIRRWGYRKSVMASLAATSMGYLCLAYASSSGRIEAVMLAAVMIGLGVCGYWSVWYTLIPESEKEERMGRAFGSVQLVVGLASVVAPVIAARVIGNFGYQVLFVGGVGLFLASGIPMFFLNHHLHVDKVSWKEFFKWAKEASFLRAGAAIGGIFINDLVLVDLWPIYVLLMVGSIDTLGWFRSVVMMFGAIFGYLVAKMFDKKKDKKVQLIGVAGGVIMWTLRLIPKEAIKILMIDSVDRFFGVIISTYFHGSAFRRAKGPETFSFSVYWLVWESVWVVAVIVLLWGVLDVLGVSVFWVAAVMMAAMGTIMSLLMEEHHRN